MMFEMLERPGRRPPPPLPPRAKRPDAKPRPRVKNSTPGMRAPMPCKVLLTFSRKARAALALLESIVQRARDASAGLARVLFDLLESLPARARDLREGLRRRLVGRREMFRQRVYGAALLSHA